MSHTNTGWVRSFSLDDTVKHKNGFTLYKITSVLFPIASPEAMSIISVWKRFSDLQKLHKNIKSLHTSLHIKGKVPDLTSGSYFNRFNSDVIEERKVQIIHLLKYIAEHPPLFSCSDFVLFLQNGYQEPVKDSKLGNIAEIRTSLQLPDENEPPLEYPITELDQNACLTTTTQNAGKDNICGETSQNIHESINERNDIPGMSYISDIKSLESTENKDVYPIFDSMKSSSSFDTIGSASEYSLPYDEIMQTTNINLPTKDNLNLPDLIKFYGDEVINSSSISASDPQLEKHISVSDTLPSKNVHDFVDMAFANPKMLDSEIKINDLVNKTNISHFDGTCKNEAKYMIEGGQLLSLGARFEDSKDYKKAFQHYKAGIEKILLGVQGDPDDKRRELAKKKTIQYLSYAESLYNNYLVGRIETIKTTEIRTKNMLSRNGNSLVKSSNTLQRSYEELDRYKIIGIVSGKVMLVLHSENQQCYIMKVIQKHEYLYSTEFHNNQSYEYIPKHGIKPIFPTNVPYMVQLRCFIETEDFYFLIMDYASGGHLLHYISNYIKSVPNTPARNVNLENFFLDPMDKMLSKGCIDSVDFQLDINNKSINHILDNSRNYGATIQSCDVISDINTDNVNIDTSVTDILINSQKLLVNIDNTLSGRNLENYQESQSVVKKKFYDNYEGPDKKKIIDLNLELSNRQLFLPPASVCKWGAELLIAIENLHKNGVTCLDLNPSNLMLAEKGHLTLTYIFGYKNNLLLPLLACRNIASDGHINPYIAPEIFNIASSGIPQTMQEICDYWSFGAIMYELITGSLLSAYHPFEFTNHTILQFPGALPLETESLLTQLLTFDPKQRLGSGLAGIQEIKLHPYFKNIDWNNIIKSWCPLDFKI